MTGNTSPTAPEPTNAASSGIVLDKKILKQLMRRNDRDGLLWLSGWIGLLLGSGVLLHSSFQSPWVVPMLVVYGGILTVSAYALSHECAHGTAFRTRWINELLFRLSSFIYLEEHTYRRYAHASHHTYTYHQGLDAQIPFKIPMTFTGWLKEVSGIGPLIVELKVFARNATGRFDTLTLNFTPQSELPKLRRNARIYLVLYAATGVAIGFGAEFLAWYFVIPRLIGAPVMILYGLLQHAEMEEQQMDIRKSTRSFSTNAASRFLYMNMSYHIEHHMFPMVPFHALPRLNREIRDQLPEPDPGFIRTNWWVLKTVIWRSVGKVPLRNLARSVPVG